MKRCIPYVVLLMSLLYGEMAPAQNPVAGFPGIQEVEKQFSEHYTADQQYFYKLARKRTGWYIMQMDYTTQQLKQEIWYWSPGTGYKELDFPDAGENKISTPFYIEGYDRYNFSRCPYYGYDGWQKDMFADFGNMAALSDTLLEGLARAYSNYSGQILNEKLVPGTPVAESLADSFVRYTAKTLSYLERIRKNSPHYQVLVGSIGMKYANEHLYAYEALLECGWPEKARRFIKPDLYDTNALISARNMMASLESNAIIITRGDNDHYSLLYLQLRYGIRPDVIIISHPRLMADFYLERLFRDKRLNWRFLPGRLTKSLDIIDVSSENKACVAPGNFWGYLALMKPSEHYPGYVGSRYTCIHAAMPDGDTMNMRLDLDPGRSLLYKNELAILDLYLSNLNRPFYYYSVKGDDTESEGFFKGNMFPRGMATQVKCAGKLNDQVANAQLAYFENHYKRYDYRDISVDDNNNFLSTGTIATAISLIALYEYFHGKGQALKANKVLTIWINSSPASSPLHRGIIPVQVKMQLEAGDIARAQARSKEYLEALYQAYRKQSGERKELLDCAASITGPLISHDQRAFANDLKKQYPVLFP